MFHLELFEVLGGFEYFIVFKHHIVFGGFKYFIVFKYLIVFKHFIIFGCFKILIISALVEFFDFFEEFLILDRSINVIELFLFKENVIVLFFFKEAADIEVLLSNGAGRQQSSG